MNRRAAVIVASLLVFGAASCGDQVGPADSSPSAEGSATPNALVVDDPLGEAPLATVARKSDLIVVGTVESRKEGVLIGSKPETQVAYTVLSIRLSEPVKGSPPPTIRVLMLTVTDDGKPLQVVGRPDPGPNESVWLLKKVDPMFAEHGDYVLTSLAGVLPIIDGRVSAPGVDTAAVQEAVKMGTAEELVQYLRTRTD